jgi:hypothetical protein
LKNENLTNFCRQRNRYQIFTHPVVLCNKQKRMDHFMLKIKGEKNEEKIFRVKGFMEEL